MLHNEMTVAYAFALDSGYQGSFEEFIEACKERDKEPPQYIVTKDGILNNASTS